MASNPLKPGDPGYLDQIPDFDVPEADWNADRRIDREYPALADIAAEEVEWIWEPYIARGKVTLIDGHPGVGKSLFTVDIASRLSRGEAMPLNGTRSAPATSLFLAPEDALGNTLKPRFEAANADLRRIHARSFLPEHGAFSLEDIESLRLAVERIRPTLIVIDPVMSLIHRDAHKDQEIRKTLMPLVSLAEELNVAVVLVRHLRKSQDGAAILAGQGSIGFVGVARSALAVARDPDDDSKVIVAHSKSNLSALGPSMEFCIVLDGGPRLECRGTSDRSADDLFRHQSGQDRDRAAEARDFLLDALADGPRRSTEVYAEASEAGISKRTLDRAKSASKVRSKKCGSEWFLELESQGCQGRQSDVAGKVANLATSLDVPPESARADQLVLSEFEGSKVVSRKKLP